MARNNGIIVLGAPRSGTTLVRRLLDAHPRIACPGETCLFSACARFLHTETVADGLEFGVINGLSFAGLERDEILSRLRDFAFGFHMDLARKEGKQRWAEKTAVDVFHLDRIEELCGDHVQYVCVVRHGLDVVCSLREFSDRGFTYLSEIHDYVREYPIVLEAFAHAWTDANASLLGFLERAGDNAVLLRYEDLIASPEAEVAKLFEFLDEDPDAGIVERALARPKKTGLGDWKTYERSEIDAGSVERWKKLPPQLVSRLAGVCNPTLEAFGYEPLPVRGADSQAAARRRYEMSMLFGANRKDGQ